MISKRNRSKTRRYSMKQKIQSQEEFEEVPVSTKSDKESGSQRKISKIFEEELESKGKTEVHISTPNKSGNKDKMPRRMVRSLLINLKY